jgi:HK97 family phage portal protein
MAPARTSFLARFVSSFRNLGESGGMPAIFREFVAQYSTSSGVSVTSDSALASVAVLACLIVRSESLMLMPAAVGQKVGRDRVEHPEHPVHRLIADAPNPFISSEDFWRWKQITEDLRGNAYARVEWRNGYPVALWPLIGQNPRIVTGTPSNPAIGYEYSGDQFTAAGTYFPPDIIHFKGPLLAGNPYVARSLIEATAENIGLGIATEQFFARFLGNGDHFPTYLQTDNSLEEKDIIALRKQMDDGAGIVRAGKVRIFDRGLKVMSRDMSLRDADLSLHQRWILEQVCRTFRVPLPMVQDLTHGTYTNSEQADLWLSKYTATPIAKSTEGAVRRTLFLQSELAKGFYAKFNVNAMMRGDFAARTAGYSILISCGVLSPNEARSLEDWNPYDGGDEFHIPVNLASAGSQGDSLASAVMQRSLGASKAGWQEPGDDTQPQSELADMLAEHVANRAPVPQAMRGTDPQSVIDALDPLIADARDRILARHAQNTERGRSVTATLEFAEVVLAPIIATAAALGVTLNATEMTAHIIQEEVTQ